MASEFTFDVTCDFDKQEFTNALDQTRREIDNRFDFKGVLASLELVDNKELVVHSDSDLKVNAIIDILESKMVKRNLSLNILDKTREPEDATGGTVRKRLKLRDTLSTDEAKNIAKIIREEGPKGAKSLIQGSSVRVSSKSKDDLQEVMHVLRSKELKLPLQFTNYR